MRKLPKVALAMIIKNEEENLPRVLGSVEGLVDGIFITDTGSTDRSVEVAKSLGATVSHFTWVNDFAAARNFSFDQVTDDYDFILWLDGDDVFEGREEFKLFKQDVLGLSDFYIAPYHYALDENGKPTCTFSRERIVRRSKKFRWNYFVHEGMIPKSDQGEVRVNIANGWSVKHLRTADDLAKDRGRNLDLFATRIDSLDSRMMYYYGKELFENGQTDKAINELLKAINRADLEPHDRILAMQYLGFAYMQKDRFVEAINIVNTGLQIAPTRAEYHVIIGDCYVKLQNFAGALPYYAAARVCIPGNPGNSISPIFYHEANYGEYPTCQMARVYANLGNMDRAAEEARRAMIQYNSKEGETLLNEIKRMAAMSVEYKNAKPCEDIVISGTPQSAYEWDSEKAKTKGMGGSETAAMEVAKHLHALSGRPVKIFNMREKRLEVDGVEYIPATELPEYMGKHKPWLHIAWRHNIKITDAPTFVWSHDLMTPGVEHVNQYDRVLCLTPFHKRFMMATQGVPADKIHVTRNGIDPTRFKDGPWTKDPFKFVFSSSPDRGLDRTILVLDEVRKEFPQVKLHIFYGIEHLPRWGHQALHDKLKAMIDSRSDWIVYHGSVQQDELMREFKSAAYCVQPSDFIETSMISARERLYCGVYQIIRSVGGVVDTLSDAAAKGHATLVDSECITPVEYAVYVEATKKAIREEAYKRIETTPDEWSWRGVAQDWLRDLPKLAGIEGETEKKAVVQAAALKHKLPFTDSHLKRAKAAGSEVCVNEGIR